MQTVNRPDLVPSSQCEGCQGGESLCTLDCQSHPICTGKLFRACQSQLLAVNSCCFLHICIPHSCANLGLLVLWRSMSTLSHGSLLATFSLHTIKDISRLRSDCGPLQTWGNSAQFSTIQHAASTPCPVRSKSPACGGDSQICSFLGCAASVLGESPEGSLPFISAP